MTNQTEAMDKLIAMDADLYAASIADTCPFCHRDPYHYVDIGVGYERAAVNCCDLGHALIQDGDEQLAQVAANLERLMSALEFMTNVARCAPGFSPMAIKQADEALHKAIMGG